VTVALRARDSWRSRHGRAEGHAAAWAGVVAVNGVLIVTAASGWIVVLGALTLVVPLALALAARPQRGLLALAALAPLEGLLLLVPGLQVLFYWKFVVVMATFSATFVATDARGRPDRRRPPWIPVALAIVALNLTSAVLVGGYQAMTGVRINLFYALVAWAAWRCPLDRRERERFVDIIVAVGVVASLWALGQQLLGDVALNALGYEYNHSLRFSGSFLRSIGTFETPFGMGFFTMLVLLIGLPPVLADPHRLRSRVLMVALPLCALGLATSVVRGGYLGVALGTAFLGWHRYRALLLLIPLGLVSLLVLPSEFGTAALSGSSSGERVTIWERALPQVLEHPLGTGVGSTGSAAEKVAAQEQAGSALVSVRDVETAEDTLQPDNYYMKTVLELGPIGLWLMLLVLLGIFGTLRRGSRELPPGDATFVASAAALVLAAMAASVVATFFEIYPMDLFFWLVIGQASAMVADHDAARARRSP
jgi:hypothetical protein